MGTDDLVDRVDVMVGRGDDQRVAAGIDVGEIGVDGVDDHGLAAPAGDPPAFVVQHDTGGIAVADRQARGGLLGVTALGKTHDLRQLNGARAATHGVEQSAAVDGVELHRIADEPHDRTRVVGDLDQGCDVLRRRHAGLVDEQHVAGFDLDGQRRRISAGPIRVVSEPRVGQRVDRGGLRTDVVGQHSGGRCRRRQADQVAAGVAPNLGDDLHRGRLAGTRRADTGGRQRATREQMAGEFFLSAVKREPLGAGVLGERAINRPGAGEDRGRLLDGVERSGFCLQNRGGGELLGVETVIDPASIVSTQCGRQRLQLVGGQVDCPPVEDRIHDGGVRSGAVDGAETKALQCGGNGGIDVAAAENRAAVRDLRDDTFRQIGCMIVDGEQRALRLRGALRDSIDSIEKFITSMVLSDFPGPLRAQIRQRFRRLLRVTGLQDRGLPYLVRRQFRRRGAVAIGVLGDHALIDRACQGPPLGEQSDQFLRNPGDLPHRCLAGFAR